MPAPPAVPLVSAIVLSQLLLLYGWFALAALMLFLIFIARFYGQFSGENTRYRLFLFTLAAYAAGWVRYASIDQNIGDPASDLALGVGGLLLTLHSLWLHRRMTHGRGTIASTPDAGVATPAMMAGLALTSGVVALTGLFGVLGNVGVLVALVTLARLSGRLGQASGVSPVHLGFYGAAVLVGLAMAARLLALFGVFHPQMDGDPLWVLLADGLPALGITLGVVLAWRYWSWLLAERA